MQTVSAPIHAQTLRPDAVCAQPGCCTGLCSASGSLPGDPARTSSIGAHTQACATADRARSRAMTGCCAMCCARGTAPSASRPISGAAGRPATATPCTSCSSGLPCEPASWSRWGGASCTAPAPSTLWRMRRWWQRCGPLCLHLPPLHCHLRLARHTALESDPTHWMLVYLQVPVSGVKLACLACS